MNATLRAGGKYKTQNKITGRDEYLIVNRRLSTSTADEHQSQAIGTLDEEAIEEFKDASREDRVA